MKIKVKTTFRRAFSLMLCMVMLFGIAPFSGMVAGAAGTYTITCYESSEQDVILWQKSYNEGDTLNVPDYVITPERTGYKFKHWSEPIPEKMPAKNISTTAQWDIIKYTITFKSDGYPEKIYKTVTADYNSTVNAPDEPVREGHTFVGWLDDSNVDSTEKYVTFPIAMPVDGASFTAKWAINKHTIKFEGNGGSETDPIVKDFGEDITKPADPTRTGYKFVGWINKETREPENIPDSMPDKDITLVAQWQIEKYTIKFDTIEGTKIPDITQDYDTIIVKPEDPKKEGYTFRGWSEEIPERMPAIPGGCKVITAVWIPNKIKITFDPNGGYITDVTAETPVYTENPITIEYDFGTPLTPPKDLNPLRKHYTFLGWVDANGKSPTNVPSEPTTYYANWVEGTGKYIYEVRTYIMNENGEYQEASAIKYSDDAGKIVKATYDDPPQGFSIDSTKSILEGELTDSNVLGNPLTLKVYLKRNDYTITFNNTGDSTINPITVHYGAAITVPANPTKEGYIFDGWINDTTGKPDTIPTVMPAANTSFTAKWIAKGDIDYKIVVNYKDVANNNVEEKKEYDFKGTTGSKVKIYLANAPSDEAGVRNHSVNDFQIEHYKIDTSADAMAQQTFEATIAADGSTVLNLIYAPVKYKVTFTVAGEIYSTKDVQYFDDASTVAPTEAQMDEYFAKEMPGYEFTRWEPELGKVTGDTTYKARYDSDECTVKFEYVKVVKENGEEITSNITPDSGLVASIVQDFNTTFTVPDYPVKAGYECQGWFDADGNEYKMHNGKKEWYKPDCEVTIPVGGLVLTAKYKAIVYGITFNSGADDASDVKSIYAPCDDVVILPAYPVKEGCKCTGWYTDGDKEYHEGDKVTMPVGGMSLTARWDKGLFNIIYKDGDKTIAIKKDIECDDLITAPDYPTEADPQGRTFIGWREKGKKDLFVHNRMPGYSFVLEAVWGYTVTFVDDNNAIIKKVALEPGAKIVAPEIPYRTGTVANGWIGLPDTMPNNDLVIKASRIYIEYTITYKVDGKVYEQQTCQYGQAIPGVDAPRKCFKKFVGWKDLPETMPAYDIEVNAEWTDSDFVKGIKAFFGGIAKFFEIILGLIN